MRATIQRVTAAKVVVDKNIVGQIEAGLLVFFGVTHQDTEPDVDWLVKKICNLRIFNDPDGKMNLSVKDIKGSILVVSQFTLYANTLRGNRPDFIQAAKPEHAERLYELFIQKIKDTDINTQCGIFGADMQVSLVNDGPVTINIEKQME